MYDPVTARFMQEDTFTGDRNDPLSLNLYTYCHNEPLMYSDPTGHTEYSDPSGYGTYYSNQAQAQQKAKQQKYDVAHNSNYYRPAWSYPTITNVAKATTNKVIISNSAAQTPTLTPPPTPVPTPTPTPNMAQGPTDPLIEICNKFQDFPSNTAYAFSSWERFYSSSIGGSVETVDSFLLTPLAFVMDYTVFLGPTITSKIVGAENYPFVTCEFAVDETIKNLNNYYLNQSILPIDKKAYEGGKSNADVIGICAALVDSIYALMSLPKGTGEILPSETGPLDDIARSDSAIMEGTSNTFNNGGVLDNANYAQTKFNAAGQFSKGGIEYWENAVGRRVETMKQLKSLIQNGEVKISQVPIDYVVRDGNTLILNTRSSQVLTELGVPRSQWNAVNRTGQEMYETNLTNQLANNKLTTAGSPTVVQAGKK